MSLFSKLSPEIRKRKLEELKVTLQLNPRYFEDMNIYKINRDAKAYI